MATVTTSPRPWRQEPIRSSSKARGRLARVGMARAEDRKVVLRSREFAGTGRVVDAETGESVVEAEVSASPSTAPALQLFDDRGRTVSDGAGDFRLALGTPGAYTLMVASE